MNKGSISVVDNYSATLIHDTHRVWGPEHFE